MCPYVKVRGQRSVLGVLLELLTLFLFERVSYWDLELVARFAGYYSFRNPLVTASPVLRIPEVGHL